MTYHFFLTKNVLKQQVYARDTTIYRYNTIAILFQNKRNGELKYKDTTHQHMNLSYQMSYYTYIV